MSTIIGSERKTPASEMGTTRPRILIADDQPDVLEALRLLLKGEGYQNRTRANSPAGDYGRDRDAAISMWS